jgi:predicted PurR-regulated permease PerM
MYTQYIASFYWATVTCTTVGYGDILPENYYELFVSMVIIVFGVSIFSYILSNLSSQFSEITRNNASNQERIQQIDQLDSKFKIGADLVEKLTSYFTNYNSDIEYETNQEMSYLLKILPATLKTQLAKFLYQDAIFVNRFL